VRRYAVNYKGVGTEGATATLAPLPSRNAETAGGCDSIFSPSQ